MEIMMRGRPAKGRKTKRKAKSGTKAAKSSRTRSTKSKKASKSRKTSKAAAKRTTGRKRTAPARKKASRKTTAQRSARGRRREDVLGEGNYTASREFRRDQTQFVMRNEDNIPEMGQQAARALDGSEGNELRKAEESARSHSAGDKD
jgi:phage protein D